MENGLFKRSGKADTRVKWLKNLFRCAVVFLCAAISWAGAADLDKFVAFIGSFAWYIFLPPLFNPLDTNCIFLSVPLCYIYPAMLHYRACAKTRKQKAADIALGVFGAIAAVYTTVQTVRVSRDTRNCNFAHADRNNFTVNGCS